VNESQTIQPARASRTLWVLLLACAGALLVITFTLASDIRDGSSQVAHATQVTTACNLPAQEFKALPLGLQSTLKEDCATLGEPAVR
jgi:hypothetical protein